MARGGLWRETSRRRPTEGQFYLSSTRPSTRSVRVSAAFRIILISLLDTERASGHGSREQKMSLFRGDPVYSQFSKALRRQDTMGLVLETGGAFASPVAQFWSAES
jgi:hypothetical protein